MIIRHDSGFSAPAEEFRAFSPETASEGYDQSKAGTIVVVPHLPTEQEVGDAILDVLGAYGFITDYTYDLVDAVVGSCIPNEESFF